MTRSTGTIFAGTVAAIAVIAFGAASDLPLNPMPALVETPLSRGLYPREQPEFRVHRDAGGRHRRGAALPRRRWEALVVGHLQHTPARARSARIRRSPAPERGGSPDPRRAGIRAARRCGRRRRGPPTRSRWPGRHRVPRPVSDRVRDLHPLRGPDPRRARGSLAVRPTLAR